MTTIDDAMSGKARENSFRVILVLVIAAFFVIAVHQHLFNVNSHYYYAWKWQWIPSRTVYPVLIPLAIPFFLGQIVYLRRPARTWIALAAVTLSTFGLMIGGAVVLKDPPSFSRISDVVQSRFTTGYFDTAALLMHKGISGHQLLQRYPTLLDHFYLHPRQKPPGLVLFEMAIIRVFGDGNAGAMASGWLIAALASLSVISTYVFIRCFTESRDAAFLGASYLALCPSLLMFYPDFDTCFPNLTALLTVLWALTLKKNQMRYALAFGLAYAVTGLITYLPGVLPIFLVGFTFLQHRTDPNCRWSRIARHLAISAAAFAAFYVALWAITGFNPIATLIECTRQVNILWDKLISVYHYPRHSLPWTFFTDLYDFALGSGWISFVLAGFYFAMAAKEGWTPRARIALVSVSQFVVIAMIGLLQTESARIWLFMYPLLMLPVGLELAKWRPWQRLAVYAALLLLTAAMCQSMEFIGAAM
jgi:hypothetical protein